MRNMVYTTTTNEQRAIGLSNLGVRLLCIGREAHDDLPRWAALTGDAELVEAVRALHEAVKAVQARVAALRESEGR